MRTDRTARYRDCKNQLIFDGADAPRDPQNHQTFQRKLVPVKGECGQKVEPLAHISRELRQRPHKRNAKTMMSMRVRQLGVVEGWGTKSQESAPALEEVLFPSGMRLHLK